MKMRKLHIKNHFSIPHSLPDHRYCVRQQVLPEEESQDWHVSTMMLAEKFKHVVTINGELDDSSQSIIPPFGECMCL
jgi:hypothetical protein